MADLLPDSTMTRATTLPTCWTLMATASNSFTRVSNTHKRTGPPDGVTFSEQVVGKPVEAVCLCGEAGLPTPLHSV